MHDIEIGAGKKYTAATSCFPDCLMAKDVCASLNMRMVNLADVGYEDYTDDFCPASTVYGVLVDKLTSTPFGTTDIRNSCAAVYVDKSDTGYVSDQVMYFGCGILCIR